MVRMKVLSPSLLNKAKLKAALRHPEIANSMASLRYRWEFHEPARPFPGGKRISFRAQGIPSVLVGLLSSRDRANREALNLCIGTGIWKPRWAEERVLLTVSWTKPVALPGGKA